MSGNYYPPYTINASEDNYVYKKILGVSDTNPLVAPGLEPYSSLPFILNSQILSFDIPDDITFDASINVTNVDGITQYTKYTSNTLPVVKYENLQFDFTTGGQFISFASSVLNSVDSSNIVNGILINPIIPSLYNPKAVSQYPYLIYLYQLNSTFPTPSNDSTYPWIIDTTTGFVTFTLNSYLLQDSTTSSPTYPYLTLYVYTGPLGVNVNDISGNLTVTGDLTVQGSLGVTGGYYGSTGYFSGDVLIGGSLGVTGPTGYIQTNCMKSINFINSGNIGYTNYYYKLGTFNVSGSGGERAQIKILCGDYFTSDTALSQTFILTCLSTNTSSGYSVTYYSIADNVNTTLNNHFFSFGYVPSSTSVDIYIYYTFDYYSSGPGYPSIGYFVDITSGIWEDGKSSVVYTIPGGYVSATNSLFYNTSANFNSGLTGTTANLGSLHFPTSTTGQTYPYITPSKGTTATTYTYNPAAIITDSLGNITTVGPGTEGMSSITLTYQYPYLSNPYDSSQTITYTLSFLNQQYTTSSSTNTLNFDTNLYIKYAWAQGVYPAAYYDTLINYYDESGINSYTINVTYLTTNKVTATTFNALSDYRIKENIRGLNNNYSVDNLHPVAYTNKLHGREDIGFIAHEVQEFFPELVTGEKDGEKNQSLNYNGFIPILVKEIQDLKKRVSILENQQGI